MIDKMILQKNNKKCRADRIRGFTLFEFAFVIAILSILGGAFMNRVSIYEDQAELAAEAQIVGTLRSALHLKMSQMYVHNQSGLLADLANENPMSWLAELPINYLGEYYSPGSKQIPGGNWYFDRADKRLVYRLRKDRSTQQSQPSLLKYKVKLIYAPASSGGEPDPSSSAIDGVVLELVSG